MIFLNKKKRFNQTTTKRRKKRFIYLVTLIFFICVLFISASYFLLSSSFFNISSIKINGLEMVSRDRFLANIKNNLISRGFVESLLGPNNILFWKINSGDIKFSNLIPKISSVNAEIELKNKSVVIFANERKLYGIQCVSNNKCYAFDKNGVVFSTAPSLSGSLLTNIKNLNLRQIFLGTKIFPKDTWIKNFFKTLDIIKKNNIPIKISIIKDYKLREWEAVSAKGFSMYFSFNFIPDNLDKVLNNLASRVNFKDLSYIDFRVPNRLFYK